MTNNGWTWVLASQERRKAAATKHGASFDGAYLAACPACGEDTWWNAFDGEPMCDCESE